MTQTLTSRTWSLGTGLCTGEAGGAGRWSLDHSTGPNEKIPAIFGGALVVYLQLERNYPQHFLRHQHTRAGPGERPPEKGGPPSLHCSDARRSAAQ